MKEIREDIIKSIGTLFPKSHPLGQENVREVVLEVSEELLNSISFIRGLKGHSGPGASGGSDFRVSREIISEILRIAESSGGTWIAG